ncbi:SdrD B-like domain-containing protein [Staphylococcus simulans]|nr:SdrD B-like domain-containing protein [Staphylococcus simulans]MDQ7114310.1 SdrD B-like domain-containing protein [Staphylococcus simulans]
MNKQLNNFEARRHNKYAIRRFSVGTASIIVGTTLLLGLGHEAKAAEEITTSNETKETTSLQPEETALNLETTGYQAKNTDITEKQLNNKIVEDRITENNTNTQYQPEINSKESTTTDKINPIEEKSPSTELTPIINKTTQTEEYIKKNTKQVEDPTEEKQIIKSVIGTPPQQLTKSQSGNPVVDTDSEANSSITAKSTPVIIIADLLKQSSQNKDGKTIETTSETTPSLRIASRATDSLATTLTAQTGSNVNGLVTVSNPQISETQIDPNQGGNFRLLADYVIDKAVKGGDYFTVQMPEYATYNGDLNYKNSDDKSHTVLATSTGMVIAEGVYDTKTKTLTYTFTDWVNDKQDISGKFDLTQFTDRNTAQKAGTYTLNYDIAGEKYSPQITYAYDAHDHGLYPASVDTMITSVDALQKTNGFQQIVYVNPTDTFLTQAFLTLAPKDVDSNAILDVNTTQLHIYKVPNKAELTDSYAFDASKYQDLAPDFYNSKRVYTNNQGELEVNFGSISDSYVVVVDSKYDPKRSTHLTTRTTLYAKDINGKKASFAFDNSVVTEFSNGTGEGTVQAYKLGDYVWEDINQDGIQETNEKPLAGVKVTLKDKAGQVLQTATTDEYGNYLFNNLVNGDYVVEFETPEGYVATTADAGNDRAKDSNGLVANVTINGADDFTIDSGFYKPVPATYNLGDYVWEDSNKDGIQNSNETGIAGVTVTLTKPDGTTETAVTDAEGKYNFADLANGEYTVKFTAPEGYTATKVNAGDQALDSNGLETKAVINNADNLTIDSGFYKPTVEPTPVLHSNKSKRWRSSVGFKRLGNKSSNRQRGQFNNRQWILQTDG